MLIILFGTIIIFISDKSRSNRVRAEGSGANQSMRCGGGPRALPGFLTKRRGKAKHLVDVALASTAPLSFLAPLSSPELKDNNLLLLIPRLSPNHLHETRI